ncbi:S-layer homology domain-containing protein [Peptoniphilus genitalis]|uniref:S-layer homology domain-containing protein n=1 Tax=Peptoniphilus genitalis TaxID=3036303 RepID=UPI0024AD7EB0|nr:S-layer homology domain-containing protein [Peptoniphilus sp. Marseille-Q7072]
MYKEKNFRLFLTILALVFVVFVPRTTMAESGENLNLIINFMNFDQQNEIKVINTKYNLDSLEDGQILVDFSNPNFNKFKISGKIVYDKTSNTIEFKSINNTESNYEILISLDVNNTRDINFNFQGKNDIKGSFSLSSDGRNPKATLVAPDLKISSHYFDGSFLYSAGPLQIVDSNIQIENNDGPGIVGIGPMEFINSNIDIQCGFFHGTGRLSEESACIKLYNPMLFDRSSLYIKGWGDLPFCGIYNGGNLTFNDSKAKIETEGKKYNVALALDKYDNESAVNIINSKVDLTSKLTDGAKEGATAFAIQGIGSFSSSTNPGRYINITNSILQTQGDSCAIDRTTLNFNEKLHDVYVKKELNEDKQLYPVKSIVDKINLSIAPRDELPKYKFVRIETHLKSFNIDADSQMVDQSIYDFIGWEAKGFIIDKPKDKKTTVKIPMVWDDNASIRAIWKKKDDGTITVVPETKYETIYKTNTVYDTKTVCKNTLSAMSYLAGYPDNTIKPEGNMTRAEAVATLVRLERLKNKDGRSLQDKDKSLYSDVKDGDWYKKYINFAFHQGWFEEKAGEKFYPDRPITRGELAQLISHVDKKNSAPASFDDVRGHKYEAAINQAYANGRIKGYEDGSFRPDGKIKRAEVATMLNHLYDRRPDKSFIDKHSNIITSFKDLDKNYWGYYELVEAFEAHEYVINDKGEIEWVRLIDSNVK